MNDTSFAGFAVAVVVCIVLGFLSWKAERWLNWKFDYGARVDSRIEQLEKRVLVLEQNVNVNTNFVGERK